MTRAPSLLCVPVVVTYPGAASHSAEGITHPSAGGIRPAVLGDEGRDDDDVCLLFSPSTNNSMAADGSRPGRQPLFCNVFHSAGVDPC